MYSVDWIPSPNYTPGSQTRAVFGRNRTTEIVVGHWWGDPNSQPTYAGVVNWFKNPASQVSAHYVVGQGKMCQMVDEDHTAWHARQANPFTIGIEFNPNANDDDYQRIGWLVYNIRQRLGNLPLRGHNVYVQTQCPGWTDLGRIDRIANNFAAPPTPPPAPTPPPTPQPEWLKNLVKTSPTKLKVTVPQAQIYDLRDGKAIKPLAYGTEIDFLAKTSVGGQEYYISQYSFEHGLPNGLKKQDVGIIAAPVPTPTPPPVATIPDYANAAIDTPDVKMYAQVDTSLVNFTTGKQENTYARGQEFDIAAETTFAGRKYYITVYSFGKKIWKGLPATDLKTTPPVDPPAPGQEVDLVAIKAWVLAIQELLDKIKNALGR